MITANTILNADCYEILNSVDLPNIDHVITDPPYDELTHLYGKTKVVRKVGHQLGNDAVGVTAFAALDNESKLADLLINRTNRWVLCFCAFEQIGGYRDGATPKRWVRTGIWHKPISSPQITGDRPGSSCEAVAIMHREGKKRWNGGGTHGFWECNVEHGLKRHPTQKPLALMVKLIELFTDPGETILDPFCGSGTTLLACLVTGRKYIGIEKDPCYHKIAVERLREATDGKTSGTLNLDKTTLNMFGE